MYRVVYKTLIALLVPKVHMSVFKALIVALLVLEAHTTSTFMWYGGEHCTNSSSTGADITSDDTQGDNGWWVEVTYEVSLYF